MQIYKRYVVALLLIFTSTSFANEIESSLKQKCGETAAAIKERKEKQAKIISSLDALLGSGQTYQIPSKVLFQIEMTDARLVNKRIEELSQKINLESLFASFSAAETTSCSLSAVRPALEELASQISVANAKKVQFLKLEPSKRTALLNFYEDNRKKTSDLDGISNQLTTTKAALNLAEQNLSNLEIKAADSEHANSETILVAHSQLNKFVVDLENEHLKFIEALQEKGDSLEKLRADLNTVVSESDENRTPDQISQRYSAVSEIWGQAAANILELFEDVKIESGLKIPEFSITTASEESAKLKFKEYSEAYLVAQNRQKALALARAKMLDDLKVKSFRILNDSGSLRANLLQLCDQTQCKRSRGFSRENLLALLREVKIVPLKLLAGVLSKWLEVKAKATSGWDGWVDLANQSVLLSFLLLIPVFLIKVLNWISRRLEALKRDFLSRSIIDYQRRTTFAVWIARVNPFIPSLGMVLSIQLARAMVEKTDLRELAGILFYFQVYYIYRIAKRLLMVGFEVTFADTSVNSVKTQKSKIAKSATTIATLIFVEYVLLHLTEDSVRQALAYNLFSDIIFWLNLGFVFFETYRWREEITDGFKQRYEKLWRRLQPKGKVASFFLLPIQFVAVIAYDLYRFVTSYLIRTDLVKKLLSEVLRKRLEGVEKVVSGSAPPKEYLKSFDYYLSADSEIFVDLENSPVQAASRVVEGWIKGETGDDLVILVGNRGMGKTTVLTHTHERLKATSQSVLLRVSPKIISETALYDWLSTSLSTSIKSLDDVRNFDEALNEKVVICIDDIQNFFIASAGGFQAYRLFLDIISLKTKNIFWCLTVNSRSWVYLKGVFGPEHFYGKVIALQPWRDFEVQKLILARHRQTNLKRSFDDSIKAYGADGSLGQQAEAQFFRLLWGQSRGNPRSALMYWISAVSSPRSGEIHVGIPSFINSSAVGSMSDDALFILSAIARHDSLTHEELKVVTCIEDAVIRKCLKEAQDKDLTWADEKGRVRISSRAQYVIDYFLIGKNFLYE